MSKYVNLSPVKREELADAIYDFIEKNSGTKLNDDDYETIEEYLTLILQDMSDE